MREETNMRKEVRLLHDEIIAAAKNTEISDEEYMEILERNMELLEELGLTSEEAEIIREEIVKEMLWQLTS